MICVYPLPMRKILVSILPILFLASVSGEEMGLHGSRHLASNMPLPDENAYANVNFEMTGHSEDLGRGNYLMTGYSFSNLDDVIQEFNKGNSQNLRVKYVVSNLSSSFQFATECIDL